MDDNKKNLNIFTFFLLFLTSFALGFYTSWKTQNFFPQISQISESETGNLDLTNFWKVYNIVALDYYGSDEIDPKKIEQWMIEWMVNSLWDKFSEYMSIEETKQFNEALAWDFEWIGAVVDKHELWVVVDMVIKWSPALENGILKWDIVTEANGKTLQDLTVTEAVALIKGPADTKVVLKILRSWENDILTKEITRKKITIPSVQSEIFKEEKIGYIALNMFWDQTSYEFEQALLTMNSPDVEWVIIDLRDNGWWYLQSAVEILSHFVEKGNVLVTTKYSNSIPDDVYYSENFWKIFDKKLVVLINENSASASEITAWALRDYKKAILVWEKSYGKWSVQSPYEMEDGSLLKLTIAKWYTPKDYSIDHNGIDPDIKVSFLREDFENKYDRQKETAKKVLKDFIKYDNIALTVEKNIQTASWATTQTWTTE